MAKISIVTVNYNGQRETEELLQSGLMHKTTHELEWVVVDNASAINPIPDWISRFPNVHFVRSAVNLGFAGGNNLGIQQATGDFLFLVNNDTLFTDGLVDLLYSAMQDQPQWGMVSPLIRYFDQPETLQYAGYTPMNYFLVKNKTLGQGQKDAGQFGAMAYPTAFVHGAAMFIRRTALTSSGLMPENYFLYFEEMDWCEMFKRKGWGLAVVPQALIYHKESMAVGKMSNLKAYFMTRNRFLFLRRNGNWLQFLVFLLYYVFLVFPRDAWRAIQLGQIQFIKQYIRAVVWNFTEPAHSNSTGFKP